MTSKEQIALIKRSVDDWNKWRATNPSAPVCFQREDFGGANLEGVDFSGTTITNSVFAYTSLAGASFRSAKLQNVTFPDTLAFNVNFARARIYNCDFNSAKLNSADLSRTDVQDSHFRLVNLTDCNFRSASLISNHFLATDLVSAKFSEAIIDGTRFFRSNLESANFQKAGLIATQFNSTILQGASFDDACCDQIVWADVDLSETLGLERCVNLGPSNVGVDTLYRSCGKIPESFLRGCGVPEDLIAFLPSLLAQPIQWHSCFISYSSRDEEFARRLHGTMRDHKMRVWFAPEDVKGGEKLHDQLFRAIQVHDKLLLVLSEQSMRSEWVVTEIRKAREVERKENRRKLFPIRLCSFDTLRDWSCFDSDAGKDLAVELREYFIPDFSNWKNHDSFEKEFAKLKRDLQASTASEQ